MPSKNVFTSNAGSFTADKTPAVTSPWPAANPQPAVTPRSAANPQPAAEVFCTEIGSQCPVCGGEVKFREIGPKRHKETTAVCSVNGRHRWKFAPGVLDEL